MHARVSQLGETRCVLLLALGLASVSKAAAVEHKEPVSLQLKPKSEIAIAVPSRNYAPFVLAASPAPEIDLLPRNAFPQDPRHSSCDPGRTLCYDPASGQLGFRPARDLMPDIPGLTRENISVNRRWIVFRYSF
jgi:hypothetical protein